MITILQDLLDQLCEAYRQGAGLILLFDYDGTLAPIVDNPRRAVMDCDTRLLLESLYERQRVSLGVLSGRQLEELKTLVRIPGLYLAGTGGLELDLRGIRIEHPQAGRAASLIGRVADRLEKAIAAYSGARLENKRLGLAVHHRQVPEHLVSALLADVEKVAEAFSGELRIVEGPRALEITPAWGWTKGAAVRLILAHLEASNERLLYAGDEANDAEAMEEVAARGGIVLGIGSRAPAAAQHRLPDHAALRTFLSRLDSGLEWRKAAPARTTRECLAIHGLWKSTLPTNLM